MIIVNLFLYFWYHSNPSEIVLVSLVLPRCDFRSLSVLSTSAFVCFFTKLQPRGMSFVKAVGFYLLTSKVDIDFLISGVKIRRAQV